VCLGHLGVCDLRVSAFVKPFLLPTGVPKPLPTVHIACHEICRGLRAGCLPKAGSPVQHDDPGS
jgi:hypothetical protein